MTTKISQDVDEQVRLSSVKAMQRLDGLVDSFDDKIAIQASKTVMDMYMKIRADDTARISLRIQALNAMTPDELPDEVLQKMIEDTKKKIMKSEVPGVPQLAQDSDEQF